MTGYLLDHWRYMWPDVWGVLARSRRVPVLLVGAIPGILYCVYLLRKNRTGKNFLCWNTVP